MASVYLCGAPPQYPCRCWFVGTESRKLRTGETVDFPRFDNEHAKLVDLAFALDAKRFWREKFGLVVHISVEKFGAFVAESNSDPAAETTSHETRFVPLTGGGVDGRGYHVRFNPQKQQWYCRADMIPSMVAEYRDRESLWADSPEAVVTKIIERWGLQIAIPYEDPAAIETARQQQERAKHAAKHVRIAGLRPGDR